MLFLGWSPVRDLANEPFAHRPGQGEFEYVRNSVLSSLFGTLHVDAKKQYRISESWLVACVIYQPSLSDFVYFSHPSPHRTVRTPGTSRALSFDSVVPFAFIMLTDDPARRLVWQHIVVVYSTQ